MKVYLASGWFNKEQEDARHNILKAIELAGMEKYSPKEDCLYEAGMDASEVFEQNIAQIKLCDAVIASTVGKDLGTLFECGASYVLGKPLIYYWPNPIGKFNLMLSESATAVFHDPAALQFYLEVSIDKGFFPRVPYIGDRE